MNYNNYIGKKVQITYSNGKVVIGKVIGTAGETKSIYQNTQGRETYINVTTDNDFTKINVNEILNIKECQ